LKKNCKFVILTVIFVSSLIAQQDLPIDLEYASYMLSNDGKVIGYYGGKNRVELLSIDHVSKHVLDCLIATEDREFYNHDGVSVKRLIKAAWETVTGSIQGGSTLTMQLARNLFLTNEQTIGRKVTEISLARDLEKKYSKEQILLLYLNTVYFGRSAYGIWVAAQEYYQKTPDKLTLLESAMIVGLLKSPSGYEPSKHPDKALKRRNIVLYNLVAVGKLSEKEYNKLKSAPLDLKLRESIGGYYLENVRRTLNESLNKLGKYLEKDQLEIHSAMDTRIQKAAENAIQFQYSKFPQNMQDVQIGLICIENNTGYVRAVVGGNPSSNPTGLNHVFQIKRQPGSSFKPFLYGSLIENGFDLSFPLLDSTIVYVDSISGSEWVPKNDDQTQTGTFIPMIKAIQGSKNLCAAYAILYLSNPDSIVAFAHRLGINSDLPSYPSISLGTGEVSPLEMARAISVFPSYGQLVKPITVVRTADKYKNEWWQEKIDTVRVLDSATCYQVTYALRTVVDSGTARSVRQYYSYPAAGKTGTTQNSTDAWFVGYTPNLTTVIWIGFDDPQKKLSGNYRYGGTTAAPIWAKMMGEIVKQIPAYYKSNFIMPEDIKLEETCIDYYQTEDEDCRYKIKIPIKQFIETIEYETE
jgi:penicillin-binding protein 1A